MPISSENLGKLGRASDCIGFRMPTVKAHREDTLAIKFDVCMV